MTDVTLKVPDDDEGANPAVIDPDAQSKMLAMAEGDTPKEPLNQPDIKAVKAVKDYAAELNIDLATVTGSGKNGFITKDDIAKAAGVNKQTAKPKPAPAAAQAKAGGKSREQILASISETSNARVNFDEFLNEQDDARFHVPDHLIPEGFSVEWKVTHIMGAPVDSSTIKNYEAAGWVPAPIDLFREMVPAGYDLPTIERDGQILMIRPAAITEKFRAMDRKKAKGQVNDKLREMSGTPEGQMDRTVSKFNQTQEVVIPVADD